MLNSTQSVLARLATADRQHQKEVGSRFLLRAVECTCAAVLLAFVIDVALHLDSGWRLSSLIAWVVGILAVLGYGVYLSEVHRNRPEHIARFLEARNPSLGSKLINLLQLRRQTEDQELKPLTRKMAGQAVEGYAAELAAVPFERNVRTPALARQFKRTAWVLLGFAVVLAAFWRVTAVEIVRFADPLGDHPPYSFTHLQIIEPGPRGTNVIYGQPCIVRVKASGHRPKEVFITLSPRDASGDSITLPMFDKGEVGFDQQLENIRQDVVVFAHTKTRHSVSKKMSIGVIMTPQLGGAFVEVAAPAYTGLEPKERPYTFQNVSALVGSQVQFRLRSNRPLREGRLEIVAGDREPQRLTLERSADNEVTGSFVAQDSGRLRFNLIDIDGISSEASWEGALTVTHDLPPEVRITEPAGDGFVALDFKLDAEIDASDDYGLSAVRIHRSLNGVFSAPHVVSYQERERSSTEHLPFDFAQLGVEPGDVISLFAEAIDTAPEPHVARSQTVRLMVIGVEDYNQFLREQTDLRVLEDKYAALLDDLYDLIEAQEQLAKAADALKAEIEQAAPEDRAALQQELDRLIAQQNELNQRLNQQADRMEHFVRDQPLYDIERALQESLREKAAAIRESTATNDAQTLDVARQSAPPDGPRQLTPAMPDQLARAAEEQAARLAGVEQEAQEEIVETLQDMSRMQELVKDFQQFEALYRTQEELAEQTSAYNRSGELNREDQLALKSLAATEQLVAEQLEALETKLRTDADAAEELFPKAAQSGRDLADAIRDQRMESLARQATSAMLQGEGDQSYGRAERLRSEMEKLFCECQGGNAPSAGELDSYLSLQKGMRPGNSFAQMSQSRQFGTGSQPGSGFAQGQGAGQQGSSGYAVLNGPSLEVMGNESFVGRRSEETRRSRRPASADAGPLGETDDLAVDDTDSVTGLNPINRQSGTVATESGLEEYREVVDRYFEAITTRKRP